MEFLNKKEMRYSLIKGAAERKNIYKRPMYCWPTGELEQTDLYWFIVVRHTYPCLPGDSVEELLSLVYCSEKY